MYNVLVTNDDGIDAAGMRQLIFTLSLTTQGYVFAPKEQQSAKSQAMSAQGQLSVEPRSIRGAEEAYAGGGTPVDCVKFGLQTMTEKGVSIDYVISGINMGLNLGGGYPLFRHRRGGDGRGDFRRPGHRPVGGTLSAGSL